MPAVASLPVKFSPLVVTALLAFCRSPMLAAFVRVLPLALARVLLPRPLATPVSWLPPLARPAVVRLTVLPLAGVMVTPLPLVTVVPVASLVVTLVRPVRFLASCRLRLSVPLATTPMLPVPDRSVAPPLMVRVLPSLRVTLLPLSPAKVSGWVTAVLSPASASPTLWTVVVVPAAGLVVTV